MKDAMLFNLSLAVLGWAMVTGRASWRDGLILGGFYFGGAALDVLITWLWGRDDA